jgi:hypothetical protein
MILVMFLLWQRGQMIPSGQIRASNIPLASSSVSLATSIAAISPMLLNLGGWYLIFPPYPSTYSIVTIYHFVKQITKNNLTYF